MAVSGGKVLGSAATGAAMGTAIMPGWGTALGAAGGALMGLFGGGDDNAAPQAPPSQFGANPLTNQLAAQQYAAGLQQQQGQNAREAALYGNANGNFDIANAAQLREGPQITTSLADKQRQLAALGGTNAAIGNVNQTGQQLTALGTRPMGPSYAEAQLRQGQDAAMAQQLSMARSGRSLGSGQAAMQQAAFNNAALNQQTNLAAANARIQEQNAYNQFQANALGAAGQQYGAAGALSGQAGNQATGIRQGNEGVQLQNAQLQQSQQGINNQTSGLYNQLGAQQQQLGMQANQLGQGAYQFGANQALGMQQSQLNADAGRTGSITATNLANQGNANLHDAATANALATAAGTIASINGGGGDMQSAAPVNPNNPSGSTSPYAGITASSHSTDTSSDARLKTNIKAIEPSSQPRPPGLKAAQPAHVNEWATGTGGRQADGSLDFSGSFDKLTAPMPQPVSYAETIAALNNGYRASQFAPTDVLNHVPGAGAGPSASQSAVIAAMQRKPGVAPVTAQQPVGINAKAVESNYGLHDVAPSNAGPLAAFSNSRGATPAAAAPGIPHQSIPLTGATRVQPAPPPAWGDVFNTPQLDPRIAAYLAGSSPYPTAPQAQSAPASTSFTPPMVTDPELLTPGDTYSGAANMFFGKGVASDVHSKTRIRDLEAQLAALQGPPTASFAPQQPDTAALDQAYAREQQAPAIDLRPARGYSYEYIDPNMPGAAPGRHVGPMAQDLEHTAAADAVHDTQYGKQVDTPRLTMTNTAAISELQRKMQQLETLGGGQPAAPAYRASLYPQTRSPY